jgi:hypothetical protein
MRVTAIRAKTERKRQDKSARYAEKRRRRAGMLRVYGSIRPTTGVCATTDPRSGRKTPDQLAQSGDPDVKRQATWGMSVYNQQLPQSALRSRSPLQAMKDWYKLKPELFKKRPHYLPGCDM